MSIAYGIIALISLCMVGICVLADKKRDIWLLLIFVSVSLCNLGYFMTAISKVRAYVNGAWTTYSTADLVYATPN